MPTSLTPWYKHRPKGWRHFQSVPLSRLRPMLIAVFALFSTWGFFSDVIGGGRDPYLVVIINVFVSGLIAVLWLLVLSRLPVVFVAGLIFLQVVAPYGLDRAHRVLVHRFGLQAVDGTTGIRTCAIGMMAAIVISYTFFVAFIRSQGKETFRLRNELDLAHGIQKTLVPPVTLHAARFEIYGISKPSEQVGGDLVDALCLANGDAIAYLADIAGHGLQAGILMGMLKTAVRTALLDAGEREPQHTLPVLLDRLNSVLPEVKEAHMYATFTGFRLGVDGSVFYALAASPPILHWHARERTLSHVEEEQFPLGLLPVSGFDGQRMQTSPGDLLVVATDGILEVCAKGNVEFGIEGLKTVIAGQSKISLPQLAAKILEAAQAFGKQLDDQTILIVRCL